MARRRDKDEHDDAGWEDSPTGSHRRPLGSNEPWQPKERTDPHAIARAPWWTRPVTLPWGALLAVAGVGAGGAVTKMVSDLLPAEVVTESELEARLSRVAIEDATRRQETERKLDSISRDIADLHDDIDALNDILEKAFPRFPSRRDP